MTSNSITLYLESDPTTTCRVDVNIYYVALRGQHRQVGRIEFIGINGEKWYAKDTNYVNPNTLENDF